MHRPSYNGSDSEKKTPNTALLAVAFQDHLMKSISLSGLGKKPPTKNGASQHTDRRLKHVKSLVDTGQKQIKKPIKQEQEYVLDAKPVSLTLAQKMGLVDAPKPHLSEADWQQVKSRSNARSDSQQPCVICKEDFGIQLQNSKCASVSRWKNPVLAMPRPSLAQLHPHYTRFRIDHSLTINFQKFVQACLEAFERFTGRKTCPMCRHEQYQTRVIQEGRKQHLNKSATIIQATWRGYVVRCWYTKLREQNPPKEPLLRKKFYENKLKVITDRMVKSCDFNVGAFLTEIDQSLKASRQVFKQFDERFHEMTPEEWEQIQLQALRRCEHECPICLTELQDPTEETQNNKPTSHKIDGAHRPTYKQSQIDNTCGRTTMTKNVTKKAQASKCMSLRKTVLLSCSHVFHLTCLQTFEELSVGNSRKGCPICRKDYKKFVWT